MVAKKMLLWTGVAFSALGLLLLVLPGPGYLVLSLGVTLIAVAVLMNVFQVSRRSRTNSDPTREPE